jgi:hypothetical protein
MEIFEGQNSAISFEDKIEKRNNYDRIEMNLTEKEIDNMPINVMDKV